MEINPKAEEQLRMAVKLGKIDRDDLEVIRRWHDDLERIGPNRLMRSRKYDDHHLMAEWWGYRAACFSPRGRIIYRVEDAEMRVEVVRITPDHDYMQEK